MFTFVTSCCSPHISTSQQKSSTECLIWCRSGCVRILPFDTLRELCRITTFDSSPSKYGYIYKIIFCKHKSPIIAMWYQCESSKRVLVLRSSSLELLHWRIFFRTQPESQMIGSFVLVYRGTRVTDNNIFQVFNQNLVLVGCAKSLMGAHGNCNSLQLSQ